jgi:hypothetical protein
MSEVGALQKRAVSTTCIAQLAYGCPMPNKLSDENFRFMVLMTERRMPRIIKGLAT